MEVVVTDEFDAWYQGLTDEDAFAVNRNVELLSARGVALPFPYQSDIKGSTVAMRELRVKSGGKQIRVFYVFDKVRDAVLLIGGDKTGNDRFYEEMVPRAEEIAKQYFEEQKAEAKRKEEEEAAKTKGPGKK